MIVFQNYERKVIKKQSGNAWWTQLCQDAVKDKKAKHKIVHEILMKTMRNIVLILVD